MAEASQAAGHNPDIDDVDQDLCVKNTVCLLEEEYECLRSLFIDEGHYIGKRLSTWKSCCTTKDPPPWKELLGAPCTGSCGHFLVVVGVCSWLGMLKIALMQHGVPNPNRLYEQMQNFYDSYFICSKPTLVKRSSVVQFSASEQRGINFLFLQHESRNIFRVSPFPPDAESQEPLTTFCQMIGTENNISQEAYEQKKLTSAREAAVPLAQRRMDCGGYFSEVDVGLCCDGCEGNVGASDTEASTDEPDIWQGFNEELPKAVAHITQQLVEQGTFPNVCAVRVLKCEDQLLRTFGPNLDQYVRDMGDLLFPVNGTHGTGQKAIIDEGIEKGLLSTEDTLLEGHEDGDGEDLGSVDSFSEESGGVESASDGSEAAEDTAAGESDALSDHMLDGSFELF